MKAPSIFIVVLTHGDGYGHNSSTYLAWYFSKREAEEFIRGKGQRNESYDVEEVPAADPIPQE